jgi:hypothetical protein
MCIVRIVSYTYVALHCKNLLYFYHRSTSYQKEIAEPRDRVSSSWAQALG